jgi:hypothetical protein
MKSFKKYVALLEGTNEDAKLIHAAVSKHLSDPIKAEKASRICNRESASNPAAANYGCVKGRSVDYSIGLFQINLLAHCPASKPSFTWNPPSCTFGNIPARDLCENRFLNQDENIKYAVQLSKNGTDWSPWSAARACGIN